MVVTRADVAREAGVSPALVSYVINGGPRAVSPEAARRVKEAVQRLDYRPNQIASALRRSKTNSIAMIVPDHENPHFAELIQHAENAAYEHGYILLIGSTHNTRGREIGYLKAFTERQVDGLLLITAASQPDSSVITDANVPVVLLDRAPAESPFSTVTIDNEAAAREAVEHLRDHGRRWIACIAGPQGIGAVDARLQGWASVLTARRRPPVISSDFSRNGGFRAMQELLERKRVPDAVFVHSDAQAIGALKACAEQGLRVGPDIALVSFDGTQAGQFTQPALTSVDQGAGHLARTGVEVLLEHIQNRQLPPIHRIEQARLRIAESCGCPQT